MNKENFIDEEFLLLERPNLREECNINTEEEMQNYLILYNTYNNLLIQYLMKKYYLIDVDKELLKHQETFSEVDSKEKDLYQKSSEGYLKYFYLRNNIYIERLSKEESNYLFNVYKSNNFELDEQKKLFIENTYLKVILENQEEKNVNINYGPDSFKYYKPSNAIIIGVRYNQFSNKENENFSDLFASSEGQLNILTDFLEYKIKKETQIPFYVIKYDEFSVHNKKKITKTKM